MNKAFSKIWISIIFGILIVGSIFAWQYFGTPEKQMKGEVIKDETANWKVYKNEEYGVEMKYPQDWELEGGLTIDFVQKDGKGIIIISKQDDFNTAISDLKKWVFGESDNVVNFKEEEILLDNVPATKITYKALYLKPMSGPGWETNIFVNRNKNLQIYFQTTSEEDYLIIFNKILSTFRFLE